MASLYRPIRVYYFAGGKRIPAGEAKGPNGKLLPGVRKEKARAESWFARYRDATGTLCRQPLKVNSRAMAQRLLAQILDRVEAKRVGRDDPFEEHRDTLLTEHLAAYGRYLDAKGDTPRHVRETLHSIGLVLKACRFVRIGDLRASRVGDWLRSKKAAGASHRTFNAYLTAIKGFCRWLVLDRRMPENPLAHLSALNEAEDRRRERRALPAEEFARLVGAARQSPRVFRHLTGADRAMLYAVAAYSGLRARELESLTPLALTVASEPPTITVEAGYSKRRRRDVQPIPRWLADRLTAWLASKTGPQLRLPFAPAAEADPSPPAAGDRRRGAKPKPERLWPGSWRRRAAEMLHADLAEARAAWIAEAATDQERAQREASQVLADEDDAGRVFDFHALRHHYVSSLAAAGLHAKGMQTLARHSTPGLTLGTYTHPVVADLTAAVEALPELPPDRPQEARATGTDDRAIRTPPASPRRGSGRGAKSRADNEAGPFARTKSCSPGGIGVHFPAPKPPKRTGTERGGKRSQETPEALVSQGLSGRVTRAEGKGFEPSTAYAAPDFESGC